MDFEAFLEMLIRIGVLPKAGVGEAEAAMRQRLGDEIGQPLCRLDGQLLHDNVLLPVPLPIKVDGDRPRQLPAVDVETVVFGLMKQCND
jgi:hypothetical protein